MSAKKLSGILLDLHKELQGDLLQDDFVIRGRKYTLRLLNEKETNWSFSFIKSNSTLSIATSVRLANLAVGIRAIDGVTVEDLFEDQWKSMSELDKNAELLKHETKQFAVAAMMLEFLSTESHSSYVSELHEKWQELDSRRSDAQHEIKNSSGEDLEKAMKTSLTESSQDGEPLQLG